MVLLEWVWHLAQYLSIQTYWQWQSKWTSIMTELLSENTNMLNISVVVCYPSLKVNGMWWKMTTPSMALCLELPHLPCPLGELNHVIIPIGESMGQQSMNQ